MENLVFSWTDLKLMPLNVHYASYKYKMYHRYSMILKHKKLLKYTNVLLTSLIPALVPTAYG